MRTSWIAALLGCGACGGFDRWSAVSPVLADHLGARERDPVASILAHDGDLSPEWQAEKACRMSPGPFPFFRATAYLMHADLVGLDTPWNGALTWVQGDAHPQNLGSFGDDEERVVYDLNDFDEAFVGDPLHDLWRLVAGTDLLAEELGRSGGDRERAAEAVIEGWLSAMDEHADGDSEADQLDADAAWGRLDEFLRDVEASDREDLLDDWTDNGRFTLDEAGHLPVAPGLRDELVGAIEGYRAGLQSGLGDQPDWFEVKDVIAVKGTGLGSLGTPRFAVLIEGPGTRDDDDRILDVKRQGPPAAWPGMAEVQRALTGEAHARRVINGQRALLPNVDDHLGTLWLSDGDYTVRERSPWKQTLPSDALSSGSRLEKVATQWGWALGTVHARGDVDAGAGSAIDLERWMLDRLSDPDAFVASGLQIGLGYAQIVRDDHRAFVDAVGCSR